MPTWVMEFYKDYGALVPKNQRQTSEFKTVRYIIVRGEDMDCYSEHINVVMERTLYVIHHYDGLPPSTSLDDLKVWLESTISQNTNIRISVGA